MYAIGGGDYCARHLSSVAAAFRVLSASSLSIAGGDANGRNPQARVTFRLL